MSTVVVVRKGDKAVIAADTLAKYGSIKEHAHTVMNPSKLVAVGPAFVGVVGQASFPLVLEHWTAARKKPPRLENRHQVFDVALELHKALRETYFLRPEESDEDEFESMRFDALVASPGGLFGLYALRSVHEYSRFYAVGSGSLFALGAMHAVYDRTEDPAEVARIGLAAAIEYDDGTGGPVELHQIQLRP